MSKLNRPAESGKNKWSDYIVLSALAVAVVILLPIAIPVLLIWERRSRSEDEKRKAATHCTLTLDRLPEDISWLHLEHMPQITELGEIQAVSRSSDHVHETVDRFMGYGALIKLADSDWGTVSSVIGEGLPGIVIYHVGGCVVNTARKEIVFNYFGASDAVAPDMAARDTIGVCVSLGEKQITEAGWEGAYLSEFGLVDSPGTYDYWLRNEPDGMTTSLSESEWALAQRLMELRKRRAKQVRRNRYNLAPDGVVGEIAKRCPVSKSELMSIPQFGPVRYGYWGEDILSLCREHRPAV